MSKAETNKSPFKEASSGHTKLVKSRAEKEREAAQDAAVRHRKLKAPVGYTNRIPGNETTECVPVFKFTPEQKKIQLEVERLEQIIRDGRQAAKDLIKLRASCNHHVFRDSPGFPYYIRECAICKEDMGLI